MDSLQLRQKEYNSQGYRPSHTVCTLMGFLMGVDEQHFYDHEASFLQHSLYDTYSKEPSLVYIRDLCILRKTVMLNYTRFFDAFRFGTGISSLLPDGISQRLYKNGGFNIQPGNKNINQYLIYIRSALNNALNSAKMTITSYVNASINMNYFLNLLRFSPCDVNTVKDISSQYAQIRSQYPWQCYLNIPGDLNQMPFDGDDSFVEWMYWINNDSATDLWRFRTDCGHDISQPALHRFLDVSKGDHRSFSILLDGSSLTVYEIAGFLRTLSTDELVNIENIILFSQESKGFWELLLGPLPCKLTYLPLSQQNADLDFKMELFSLNPECGILFGTGSANILADCESILSGRAVYYLINRSIGDDVRSMLSRDHLCYGYAEDFTCTLDIDRQALVLDRIISKFPFPLDLNLTALLNTTLDTIPLNYTKEEQHELLRTLCDGIHLNVTSDGKLTLLFQR